MVMAAIIGSMRPMGRPASSRSAESIRRHPGGTGLAVPHRRFDDFVHQLWLVGEEPEQRVTSGRGPELKILEGLPYDLVLGREAAGRHLVVYVLLAFFGYVIFHGLGPPCS